MSVGLAGQDLRSVVSTGLHEEVEEVGCLISVFVDSSSSDQLGKSVRGHVSFASHAGFSVQVQELAQELDTVKLSLCIVTLLERA